MKTDSRLPRPCMMHNHLPAISPIGVAQLLSPCSDRGFTCPSTPSPSLERRILGSWLPLFAALIVLLAAAPAGAAEFYIRQGATGNGLSWTNALGAIPSTLQRGAVYYFADGEYGSYELSTAESGSQLITFKKALDDTRCARVGMTTAQCRGTGTGWVNSYGDGVAKFDSLQVNRGYFIIDGQLPCSDIRNCQRGFLVGGGQGLYLIGVSSSNVASNLAFKSITVDGIVPNLQRGFRFCCNGGHGVILHDIEIKNVGNDPIHLGSYGGVDINRLYIHSRINGPNGETTHADAMEVMTSPPAGGAKNTLRNSIINWDGQQMWFTGGSNNPVSGEWDIFSNVWTSPACGTTIASVTAIKFRSDDLASSAGPLNIFNNTFACLYNVFRFSELTTGSVYNNIFFGLTTGVGGFNKLMHDSNYFDAAMKSTFEETNGQAGQDPFMNLGSRDFRLRFATNHGRLLLPPFNIDKLGSVRGSDGVWDRGAYEFSDAPQLPSPPQSLTLSVR